MTKEIPIELFTNLSDIDLILMRKEVRAHPEDKDYVVAIDKELKKRVEIRNKK